MLYRVEFQDPGKPDENHYIALVQFDPSVKRGFHTDDDFRRASAWTLEKLLSADFPAFPKDARIYACPTAKKLATLASAPTDIGAGITIWLEHAPESSRLRNPALLMLQLAKMREEVRRQPLSV